MGQPFEQIFLARHGQTEWNLASRWQGQLDSPLTAEGREAARRTAPALDGHKVNAIFCSPLGRAATTAQLYADHLELPVTVLDELAELHHGDFAGLTIAEVHTRYPGALDTRDADKYHWRFPGEESYADAYPRAAAALATIARTATTRPLLVSHEMIGRMLLAHLLDLPGAEALALKHPHRVIYQVDPDRHTLSELHQ